MRASLAKLAALPAGSRVFCAHEYTLANLQFALQVEPENRAYKRLYTIVRRNETRASRQYPQRLQTSSATTRFSLGQPEIRQTLSNKGLLEQDRRWCLCGSPGMEKSGMIGSKVTG